MIALFSITVFLSAMLLFSIQPMVGKMILPRLGGSPAVWNTCMVFFQAALLGGYAYAHGSVRQLGARRQAGLHLLVLLAPLAVLPISLSAVFNPVPGVNPTWPLLAQLATSVGLPFLVVSASAPLLQAWFARTNHPSARDPYFLYAASNLGSMIALIGYPLVIEPRWTLYEQTRGWAAGYCVLAALALVCASAMWLSLGPATGFVSQPTHDDRLVERMTWRRRAYWIVLSFVPSSLMLGVTAHVTTDIAAVPLLWVGPLALYLLTFVIVFAKHRVISTNRVSWLLPYVFLPLALLTYADLRLWSWLLAAAHMAAFFVAALMCHGRLADSRPNASRLTEYYLLISVGGVLGGIFNAIAAPMMFTRVVEYPLMLVAACLLRPVPAGTTTSSRSRFFDVAGPVAMAAALISLVYLFDAARYYVWSVVLIVLFALPAMLGFSFKERPVRFALAFGAIMLSLGTWRDLQKGGLLDIHRNFFGVKRVVLDEPLQLKRLYHGVTQHGAQSTLPERKGEPLTYYGRSGPLGDLFAAYEGDAARSRVAVIGLGAGAIATYARTRDHYTIYEIDPEVAGIAEDPDHFTYLSTCKGQYDIVLGDGRLTLSTAAPGEYGMIIVDAFSSDAVPTHLITKEAIELYVSRLRPDGVLALHISNRFLAFEPMLGNLARDLQLTAVARVHLATDTEEHEGLSSSHWVAMGRSQAYVERLHQLWDWSLLQPQPDFPVWTDQFCDIISLFTAE